MNIKQNKMDYIKFSKGKQTEFLRKVKSNLDFTWIKIAKILGVDRSMIYFYLDESCKMSHTSFVQLCNLANLNPEGFKFGIINIPTKGKAVIPNKLTYKLAEFIGILLGDGSISRPGYQICISMDSVLDDKYINTLVKEHFIQLFKKEPTIYYSKTNRNVRCLIYSKDVFDYLTTKLGLPSGEKKYKPNNSIPRAFFNDNNLLRNTIRGLFDTEGGIYQHNKTSPRLYIYNTSEPLLESIHSALLQLGYKAIRKKRWIKICKKEEITRFFNEIGTNNPQKRLKYDIWLKEGKVPLNNRILKIARQWSSGKTSPSHQSR
ncbi:hypothetical protein CMO89_04055 [Candidatus Woesearchaeota archaeon]|nr:hypothetical protein [Candidatus Woesearchaeota archaeon]|tara:strand:- start:8519 stop:9472 length:954 start_codon:yes stop_codon:yes gene_type:complete